MVSTEKTMFCTLRGKSFSWGPIDSRARAMVEAAMEMKGWKNHSIGRWSNHITFIFTFLKYLFQIWRNYWSKKDHVNVGWQCESFGNFFFFQLWDESEKVDKPLSSGPEDPIINEWIETFISEDKLFFFSFSVFVANFLKCRYSSIVRFLCITICKNSISQFHSDIGAL